MRPDIKGQIYKIVNESINPMNAVEIMEKLEVKPALARILTYLCQLNKAKKIERVSRGRYQRKQEA